MSENLLALPERPGRLIFEADSFMSARLLRTEAFVKYCKERDLGISPERLRRLEALGVFRPVTRFVFDEAIEEKLRVPNGGASAWFDNGYLIDTYHPKSIYDVPEGNSEDTEAYYSIFQIDHLSLILNEFSLTVSLDAYAGKGAQTPDWNERVAEWLDIAEQHIDAWQTHEFRRAIPILCQYVANRYYAKTQTNQRSFQLLGTGYSEDPWMAISGRTWDWYEHVRSFDPKEVEARFALTPAILKHAYETIGGSAAWCDPLDNWSNLVEFVSVEQKKRLKGKALRALAYRDAANMLRWLYRDLYGEELKPTDEIYRQVITHFPELDARDDVRRHLEFVVNQYDLNPQPKLVLFVEGESEVVLVTAIFEEYFGAHPGISGIEIINLLGVNNATGAKKADRFRAIFRLIDYLHHHQTLTYLILDRENHAEKLKLAAQKTKSIHGQDRLAVPEDHIQLWNVCLEFDNFSDTELAKALTQTSDGHAVFKRADVKTARRSANPGKALSDLFEKQTGYGLDKPELAAHLARILLDPKSRRNPENRPLVKILNQVELLALRNPFPQRRESWNRNQKSEILGGSEKIETPKKRST